MDQRRPLSTLLLAAALGLAGCDAWPTHAINRSPGPILFRWHQKDYAGWSAPLALAAGQAESLARAHYVEDFTGLQITDGRVTYTFMGAEMNKLRHVCIRSFLDHLDTLGDCDLSYLGRGRVSVRRVQ